jgi:hypothetical protein
MAAAGNSFTDEGMISPHYLPAGGILFSGANLGYEFSGQNYANIFYFEHDVIGVTETEGIGENGPCVGCHMTAVESHLFSPIEEETGSSGAVSVVTSPVCGICHSTYGLMTASVLNSGRDEFEKALDALNASLAANSIFYSDTDHDFFTSDGGSVSITSWPRNGDPSTAQNNFGSAFNLDLLYNERGAYVHNSWYTKMVIFDSIDWLDDNILGGTIDLTNIPGFTDTLAAAQFLHTDSATSVDPSDVDRPDPSPPF